jgi:hypothetical protein
MNYTFRRMVYLFAHQKSKANPHKNLQIDNYSWWDVLELELELERFIQDNTHRSKGPFLLVVLF